jgi:predicted RNA-binding Zn-ribbon protein involved in translation (DUF1610 family)
MINRTWIKCLSCEKPITARIQVGHEREQAVVFACPHCGTDIRLTLILDEPPLVKVRWDDNCDDGTEEGTIVNIGAGFTIPKDKLHLDKYFPSFDAPRPTGSEIHLPAGIQGPLLLDSAVALGTLPYAAEKWSVLHKALNFHRTGQADHLATQLSSYWGDDDRDARTIDEALYNFFGTFLMPRVVSWLDPLAGSLKAAHEANSREYISLVAHYDADLKAERFKSYTEIFTEYFRAYSDFSQTLVYVRLERDLPEGATATSTDFDKTRMFYGNAFEVLGSHLDVIAALNNVLEGRSFDTFKTMDLKKYRSLNKASRTQCFESNALLSWLVRDYDSTIRNASHHRWFRLDESKSRISYRSGGTGALNSMTYAEYLVRCNRMAAQLMVLACMELVLLSSSGKSL